LLIIGAFLSFIYISQDYFAFELPSWPLTEQVHLVAAFPSRGATLAMTSPADHLLIIIELFAILQVSFIVLDDIFFAEIFLVRGYP
jgi:uncharacterized membrane protein